MLDNIILSRRSLLSGAIKGVVASLPNSKAVPAALSRHSRSVEVERRDLTKLDIDAMMKELSNWNRWGKSDQIGTVNLITQGKRKHAISLAREGIVISLSHPQDVVSSSDNTQPLIHTMNSSSNRIESGIATDTYTMTYHGSYYTHMDALSHMSHNGYLYNGYPATVVTNAGAGELDIAAFKAGIVTRGILIDIPRLKGIPYLEPETPVYPEDLDAWERTINVKVTPGDMVLIRFGRWARREQKGPWSHGRSAAGLYATCARWLRHRDIAILASDGISDVHPSTINEVPLPIHKLVIVAMGAPILDNCDLELLGNTAASLHRWEFLITAAPMVIPGGTGSPLNPLAIF